MGKSQQKKIEIDKKNFKKSKEEKVAKIVRKIKKNKIQ